MNINNKLEWVFVPSRSFQRILMFQVRRHNTQHIDIQHCDTQHDYIQYNDTKYNDTQHDDD